MKNANLMNKVSGTIHKVGFQLKKYSPEIFIAAGVIGVVASTIMACKSTTKVSKVIDDAKENLDIIHAGAEKGELGGQEFTEDDAKKAVVAAYVHTGVEFAKLYGPSVVLGGLSLASILTSNNILRKRNVALAAAYATVDKSFKEYRGRVTDRFGEEIEREIRHGVQKKEVEKTVVNEDGSETVIKETVDVIDREAAVNCSPYAKFFDEASPCWEKDADYNLMFLKAEQSYANDLLKSRGYLFLNEVYRRLGIPETRAGQTVGWIYDEKNPIGDNYVDFGIFNYTEEKARDFVNGYERCILLDFNVDGDIMKRNSWATI